MANPFGAPWVVKMPDGTEQKFPLLKMRQIATLQAVIQAERSEIARRLASEQKLKPEESAKIRAMMEREEIDIVIVRVWAQSPNGCVRVLQESLGAGSDDVIDSLAPNDAIEAALRVTGWVPQEPKAAPANPSPADAP